VNDAPLPVVEYGGRRTLIVAGVMMAALLQTLDATIVNVALPTIEGNIGASLDDGIWIITGYIISNVVAIPLAPFLLQRLGRRQYYATCIIGFTVASFLCGTASSLPVLVFYRVVQGAFGGGLIATSQIVLRDTLPPEKLGASSALFAIALTVGPALGPTIGGALTDNFSWQWIFDINILPGIAAATIVLTTLRNPTPARVLPLDAFGIALLAATLGSMQYVLDEGERNDWFDDGTIVFFLRPSHSDSRASCFGSSTEAPTRSSICACFVTATSGSARERRCCSAWSSSDRPSFCRSTCRACSALPPRSADCCYSCAHCPSSF
jgi:MFS family permease